MLIVFGSLNMDLSIAVERFPQPGETIKGYDYQLFPGGKGGNQAIAAARMGEKVALVGRVGDDETGDKLLHRLRREGILSSGVARSTRPTGMAVVTRNQQGENYIVVSPGANHDATANQVPDEILLPGNTLLAQAETPLPEVWDLLARAKEREVTTIFNPAPVARVPEETWPHLDYLILNDEEARQMTQLLDLPKEEDAQKAALNMAKNMARKIEGTCIITCGKDGAVAATAKGRLIIVPALEIDQVVDTTGAGDAFCGTFAATLQAGKSIEEAMTLATVAGSLSCLKPGAQTSYPYLGDIKEAQKAMPAPIITEASSG